MRKKIQMLGIFFLALQIRVAAQYFTPEEAGSSVAFSIRNFGISTKGSFEGFSGKIRFDPKTPGQAFFDVSLEAASINTGNSSRDRHLRTADFFDTGHFPMITIKSEAILPGKAPGTYILQGTLTIRGTSRKLEIPFSAKAVSHGYLFEGDITVNRLEYKIGGNSLSLSDNATVHIKLSAR